MIWSPSVVSHSYFVQVLFHNGPRSHFWNENVYSMSFSVRYRQYDLNFVGHLQLDFLESQKRCWGFKLCGDCIVKD